MSALVLYAAPAVEPLSIAEVMEHCGLDASNQEPAPGEITAALASPAAAGNVNAGAHRYLATFVTANGETQAGQVSAPVTVANAAVNGQVALSAIPIGGSLVTARKLYRTAAGGTAYLLLATIANNTATTYTDNIADAALGAEAPTTNATSDPLLSVLIKSARLEAESATRSALITQTWDLYLDRFPDWEMHIPAPPLQSVSEITYVNSDGVTTTLADDQYLVDTQSKPGRITPAYGLVWPVARYQNNAIKVRFVAGYGGASAVPDTLKAWLKLKIGEIHPAVRQPMPEYAEALLRANTYPSFAWEKQ